MGVIRTIVSKSITAAVVLALIALIMPGTHTTWSPVRLVSALNPVNATDNNAYRTYLAQADGRPVSWTPCRPIHVEVNTAGAPQGAVSDIRAAAGELTRRTGWNIAVTTTTSTYSDSWGTPGVHGYRPVLVTFAPGGSAGLDQGAVASYTPYIAQLHGQSRYVTGQLRVDQTRIANRLAEVGTYSRYAIYLHEMSHMLGLGHVQDETSIMSPTVSIGSHLGSAQVSALTALKHTC